MAPPTSYTDAELRQFMLTTVGGIGTTLGLTTASFEEAVYSALFDYGVTSIASATDMLRLRALATVHAWRTAQAAASAWYDFSADGAEFKRSQVLETIANVLQRVETSAVAYANSYAVGAGTMLYANDPYVFAVDSAEDP